MSLRVTKRRIEDISGLADLTDFTELYLDDSQIIDISPLAGLTKLGSLYLIYNQISDIGPLVKNTGLGIGDTVIITNNLLDCEDATTLGYLQTLLDRGVKMDDDCP